MNKHKKSVPFEGPINLKQWAKEHPASTFTHKGVEHKITGKRYCCQEDDNLNSIQKLHQRKILNVYDPIEAYNEKWEHHSIKSGKDFGKYVSANPIPGTKVRNDLPPLYLQWKEAFRNDRKK
mgnify:FL=1